LLEFLHRTFTPDKLAEAFWKVGEASFDVVLFGEGYGGKIQKGGNYRPDVSFRLFDVLIGRWWLKWEDICGVAAKLGVKTVPAIGMFRYLPCGAHHMDAMLCSESWVAKEDGGQPGAKAEGVVAREPNGMFMRNGSRVMWKLKFKDFDVVP
jgi:hypothetical protein